MLKTESRPPEVSADTLAEEGGPGRWYYRGLLAAILAIGVWLALRWQLTPDLGYFMWVVGQMLDGRELYVDLPEVNPPLCIWLLYASASVLRLVHVQDPRWPPIVLSLLQVGFAASLIAAMLARNADFRASQKAALLSIFVVVSLWLPAGDFANREHQVFVLLAPYLVCSAIYKGSTRQWPLRFLAGVGAGVAVSFKPHFVMAAACFELIIRLVDAPCRRLVRPESIAAAFVVLVYAAAVVLLAPGYLRIMRDLGAPYLAAFQAPLGQMLADPHALLAWAVGLLGIVASRRSGIGRTQWTFAIAALLLTLVAVSQRKGWTYHFLPGFACAALSVGAWAASGRWLAHPRMSRYLVTALAGVTIGIAIERWGNWIGFWRDSDARTSAVYPYVRQYSPHGDLLVVSWDIAAQYPMVNDLKLSPLSGYPSMWHLDVLYSRNCDSSTAGLREVLYAAVRSALPAKRLPPLLLVDNRDQRAPAPGCGTILQVLAGSLELRSRLARYERVGVAGWLDVYALQPSKAGE